MRRQWLCKGLLPEPVRARHHLIKRVGLVCSLNVERLVDGFVFYSLDGLRQVLLPIGWLGVARNLVYSLQMTA